MSYNSPWRLKATVFDRQREGLEQRCYRNVTNGIHFLYPKWALSHLLPIATDLLQVKTNTRNNLNVSALLYYLILHFFWLLICLLQISRSHECAAYNKGMVTGSQIHANGHFPWESKDSLVGWLWLSSDLSD